MDHSTQGSSWRARLRVRLRPQPTPDTTDAVNIALAAESDDPAPDSSARVLLAKQARLVEADIEHRGLQIKSERVSLTLRRLTVLVGVGIAAVVLYAAYGAWQSRGVVVDSFDAPPAFAQRGLSGNVVAANIQDSIAAIQSNVRTTAKRRAIDNAWTGDIAVQVPQTGVSIGELQRILRRALGRETYITGSLVQDDGETATLTIRGTGIAPKAFSGPTATLPALVTAAGEYVYGAYEPRLFAIYLFQKRRFADGEAFITSAFSRADDSVRPELLVYWGLMLNQQQRHAEAVVKLRLGVTQDSTLWRGWNSLVSNTRRVSGDEASWKVGLELTAAAEAAPADNKPSALGWYNFQSLTQDWSGQIENLEEDAKKTGGGGSFGMLSATLLADAELRRHDWAGARRYVDMADPKDEALPPMRLFARGYEAIDRKRPDLALAPLEAFYEMWLTNRAVSFQYDYGHCHVALARGLAGLPMSRVNEVFDSGEQSTVCNTLRGDVAEARGSPAEADAAYRRAIRRAPSLPFGYQRWGLTLLARGDLVRAEAMLKRAAIQAPRWADPKKALGDLRARQGRWADAVAYYRAAVPFAPRWASLRVALVRAEAQVAKVG